MCCANLHKNYAITLLHTAAHRAGARDATWILYSPAAAAAAAAAAVTKAGVEQVPTMFSISGSKKKGELPMYVVCAQKSRTMQPSTRTLHIVSVLPVSPRPGLELSYQTALFQPCVLAADYASVLNRIRAALALGAVTRATMGRIGVGYMGLVALAVMTNTLTLRLPLIYYKQRRSKVCLLLLHSPLLVFCGGAFCRAKEGQGGAGGGAGQKGQGVEGYNRNTESVTKRNTNWTHGQSKA